MGTKMSKLPKNKKSIVRLCISALIVIVGILCIAVISRPNGLKETKTVSIEQGLSTGSIADVLKDEKVISSKLFFLLKVNLSKYKGQLKYGSFEFSPDDGYDSVIQKLATGGAKRDSVSVTVPEGYSAEKIIALLSQKGLGSAEDFKNAMNDSYDYDFLKNINPPKECKYKLQGFLFPSTYEFYKDSKPHDIIDKMLSEFEKQYKTLSASYDKLFEVITKASMIERESKTDEDRPKIAGVIENRLNTGMKLQIDATVVYAISDGMYDVNRVYYKDLEVDSPYNTYKYNGLPVGPIASPGLKSIEAALNPEKHDYFYYRTDSTKNDGSHVFSKDFEEHKAADK